MSTVAKSIPPLSKSALVRRLGPFAMTALVAWFAVPIGTQVDWTEYGISLVLLAIAWSYGLVVSLRGNMLRGTVLGSLGFLAALGTMRDAAGGQVAAVSIVSLLPVFQTALYVRERRGLVIVLAGLAVFYLLPLIVVGAPEYPNSGYRGAGLGVLVSAIVGLTSHGLVADIRRRASEARDRERILVRVNETLQSLYRSPQPRRDACRAVLEVSDALVAGLYEPDPATGMLVVTSSTGAQDAVAARAPARPGSAVHQAFTSKRRQLLRENIQAHVGNVEFWRRDGAPELLLYQPLLKGDQAVGVLFVGWADRVASDSQGVVLASLLSHEIATVLDRQNVLEQLTGEALTDPLTELPNRRAWDSQIALAMSVHREHVAVAIFDIDYFKQFNDSYGHPAGDRLLRETAAAWRAELRASDFLARMGGEEFALLLRGRDVSSAEALVHRLRARMPADQTVSAGIAVARSGDSPSDLVSRADEALYLAKAGGRDRAVFADDPGATVLTGG